MTHDTDATDQDDVFARAAERRRVLAAQLSKCPIEDVLGLVGAKGAGGWPAEDDRWTLSFDFFCWRIPPGPMKTRPLSVEYTTPRNEFDLLKNRIATYSVYRIRARVVEESVTGAPQAQLLEFLGPDRSDPELNRAAIDLQTPVVIHDPLFGKLTLDRRVDWYTAKTKWNGRAVVLKLDVGRSGAIDEALTAARALWNDSKRWTERILDYAVQELLPVKNESWLDEDAGEAELTAARFRPKIKLKSITVKSDGSFEFWHTDVGLFSGHWIQVSGDLIDGPTDVDVPG